MASPSIVEEPVESGREDHQARSGAGERIIESPAVGHADLRTRIRNELWQPRYLTLAIVIVVLIALQIWILF